jgi:hypothetical protein
VVTLTVRPSPCVIWGRVVLVNVDHDAQNATVRMTTHDGQIELDAVSTRLAGRSDHDFIQVVSLQVAIDTTKLPLDPHTDDKIIDIRCSTFKGLAQQASLISMSVDTLFHFQ